MLCLSSTYILSSSHRASITEVRDVNPVLTRAHCDPPPPGFSLGDGFSLGVGFSDGDGFSEGPGFSAAGLSGLSGLLPLSGATDMTPPQGIAPQVRTNFAENQRADAAEQSEIATA